jgi:uncharacterized protein HemX
MPGRRIQSGLPLGLAVGLLLGFVLGTVMFPGDTDSRLQRRTEDLRRQLEAAEDERRLQAAEVERFQQLAEQMTERFRDLEHRFQALSEAQEESRDPTPTPFTSGR